MRSIACWACAPISAPGISAESSQALAAGATLAGLRRLHGAQRQARSPAHDRRRARLKAPQSDRRRLRRRATCWAPATALARQISTKTVAYGTRNPQALEAYMKALETGDATVMEVGLGVAIAADPDFVPPYRLLAEIKAQRQDRAGARRHARPGPGARQCDPRTGARPPGIGIRRIERQSGRAADRPRQARQAG